MAVAYDAVSSHTVAAPTGSTFSWTHTPSGTPRGVLVFIAYEDTTDKVSGVTYGGVSMTEVTGSPNLHTHSDSVATEAWFLGSSVPTGAQTVEVTHSLNLGDDSVVAAAYTVTASNDTEIVDVDVSINTTAQYPRGTLSLSGKTCFVAESIGTGRLSTTTVSALSGWTEDIELDMGSRCGGVYRYNTVGSSDVTTGFDQTASEVVTCCAVAITETAAGATGNPYAGTLGLTGVGI